MHALSSIAVCEILAAVFESGDAVFIEEFLCFCVVKLLVERVANSVADSHMRDSFQLGSWVSGGEAGTRNQRFARGGIL